MQGDDTRVDPLFFHPQAMAATANVGFTTSATWIGYSPAKNSIAEGIKKLNAGISPMTPSTAEQDMYNVNGEILRRHGCLIDMPKHYSFCDIPVKFGAMISLSPHFAISKSDLAKALPTPAEVRISSRSVLLIQGEGEVVIESLNLDGTLAITVARGGRLVVRNLSVSNRGWELRSLTPSELESPDVEEIERIRGYTLEQNETAHIGIDMQCECRTTAVGSFSAGEVPVVETQAPAQPSNSDSSSSFSASWLALSVVVVAGERCMLW